MPRVNLNLTVGYNLIKFNPPVFFTNNTYFYLNPDDARKVAVTQTASKASVDYVYYKWTYYNKNKNDYYRLNRGGLVGNWRFLINAITSDGTSTETFTTTPIFDEEKILYSTTAMTIQYYLLPNVFFQQDVLLYGYEFYAVEAGSILVGVRIN